MTNMASSSGVGDWQQLSVALDTPTVGIVDSLKRVGVDMLASHYDTFEESAKLSTEHSADTATVDLLVHIGRTEKLSMLVAHELLQAYVLQYNVHTGGIRAITANPKERVKLVEQLSTFLRYDRIAQFKSFMKCCQLRHDGTLDPAVTTAIKDIVEHPSAFGAVLKLVDKTRDTPHLHIYALQSLLWLVHAGTQLLPMVETIVAALAKHSFGAARQPSENDAQHSTITSLNTAILLETLSLEDLTQSRIDAILATLATHLSDVHLVKHAHLSPVYLAWAVVMAEDKTQNDEHMGRLLQVAGEHDVIEVIHAQLEGRESTVTHELICTVFYGLLDAVLGKFDHRSLADIHTMSCCVASIVRSSALADDVWSSLQMTPPDAQTPVTSVATFWAYLLLQRSALDLTPVVRVAAALARNGAEEGARLIVHALEGVPVYACDFDAVPRNSLTVNDDGTVTLDHDFYPLGEANDDARIPAGTRGLLVQADKEEPGSSSHIQWSHATNVWRLMHHHMARVIMRESTVDTDVVMLGECLCLVANLVRAHPDTMSEQMNVFIEVARPVMVIYGNEQSRHSLILTSYMSILSHCTTPSESLRHLHSISLTPHVLVDGRAREWSGGVHQWLAAICPSITVGGMDDDMWRRGMNRETIVKMLNDFVKILNANVEPVSLMSESDVFIFTRSIEWLLAELLPIVHRIPNSHDLLASTFDLLYAVLSRVAPGDDGQSMKLRRTLITSLTSDDRHVIADLLLRLDADEMKRLVFDAIDSDNRVSQSERALFMALCIVGELSTIEGESLSLLMNEICFGYDTQMRSYGQNIPLHAIATHIEHTTSSPQIVRMCVLTLRACISSLHHSRTSISLVLSLGAVRAQSLADACVTRLGNMIEDVSVKMALLMLMTVCVERQPAMAERLCDVRWTDAQNDECSTIDVVLNVLKSNTYTQLLSAAYSFLLVLFKCRSPKSAWTTLQTYMTENRDQIWTYMCAPLRQAENNYYTLIAGKVLHICALQVGVNQSINQSIQVDVDTLANRAVNAHLIAEFVTSRLLTKERICLLYDRVMSAVVSLDTDALDDLLTAVCQWSERNLNEATFMPEGETASAVRAEWLMKHAQLNAALLAHAITSGTLPTLWKSIVLFSSCTSIMLQSWTGCVRLVIHDVTLAFRHITSSGTARAIVRLVSGITHSLTTSVSDDWRRAATSDTTIRCVRCVVVLNADHDDADEAVMNASTRATFVSQMCTLLSSLSAQLIVDEGSDTRHRLMRRIRYTLKCLRHDLLDGCSEESEAAWLTILCDSGSIGVVVDTLRRLCDEHVDHVAQGNVENRGERDRSAVFTLNKSSILNSSNRQKENTTMGGFLYGDKSTANHSSINRTLNQSAIMKTVNQLDDGRLRLVKTCLSFVGALMCNEAAIGPLTKANFSFVCTLNLRPAVTPPGDHALHHAILRKLFTIYRAALKTFSLRDECPTTLVDQCANMALCYSTVIVSMVTCATVNSALTLTTAEATVALLEQLPLNDTTSGVRFNEKWSTITRAVGMCVVRMAHEVVQPGHAGARTMAHASRHRSSSRTMDRASTISMYDLSTPRASVNRQRKRSTSQPRSMSRCHDPPDMHKTLINLLASSLAVLQSRTPALDDLVDGTATTGDVFVEFDFAASGVQLDTLPNTDNLPGYALNYGCLMHITHVVYAALKKLDRSASTSSPSAGRHSSVALVSSIMHTDREQLWSIIESAVTVTLSQASLHILSPRMNDAQRALIRHELSSELMDTLKLLARLCGASPPSLSSHSSTPHKSALRSASSSSRMSTSPYRRQSSTAPSTANHQHAPFVLHALDYVQCLTEVGSAD